MAVDPSVIPLGTRVFVPGYGPAVAADVGSAVKGLVINLWMPTTIQLRARGGRTRHHHRLRLTAVRSRPILAAVAALLGRRGTRGCGDRRTRLEDGLGADEGARLRAGISRAQTAALAVELSTGAVVLQQDEALPVIPASNEKLPLSWAALKRLGPGLPLAHGGVRGWGALLGSTWSGDLVLKGFGDPTLTAADIDQLAAKLRASRMQHITGRVLGDEGVTTATGVLRVEAVLRRRRDAALLRPSSSSRARGWPALSPHCWLRGGFAGHRVACTASRSRAVRVWALPLPDAASLANRRLRSPLRDRAHDESRERQFLRGDAFEAACRSRREGWVVRVRADAVVIATLKESGIPVTGVRMVTARGCRAWTGSRQQLS